MERTGLTHIRAAYVLLHIVLWSICIQSSRQTNLSHGDSTMLVDSYQTGTSSSEVTCLQNRASSKFLRIRGRKEVDAMGEGEPSPENRLILRTINEQGAVTIKGEQSRYYLCVTRKGEVVGRRHWVPNRSNNIICQFRMNQPNHLVFDLEPVQFTAMKVGFKRDGTKRNARNVAPYKRTGQFKKLLSCTTYAANTGSLSGTRSEHDDTSLDLKNNRRS